MLIVFTRVSSPCRWIFICYGNEPSTDKKVVLRNIFKCVKYTDGTWIGVGTVM